MSSNNGVTSSTLLTNAPTRFDDVTNDLRSNLPPTWEKIKKRLDDFHKGGTMIEKTEQHGTLYKTTAAAATKSAIAKAL